MPANFTEQQVENMMIAAGKANGWKYINADELPRQESEVMVESMVKAALIRLNPCITEKPENADTVIYRLRALISTVQPHDLVTQNERFKKLVFEENSFPFDKDGVPSASVSSTMMTRTTTSLSSPTSGCIRRRMAASGWTSCC